jgi:acyl CoA:acetate/3-ketoacid CoA transferase
MEAPAGKLKIKREQNIKKIIETENIVFLMFSPSNVGSAKQEVPIV